MADENVSVLSAIWRFVTFYRLRKALGIARAADRQFTGSVGGIRDAFDLQQNKMVNQFRALRDAIAEVEAVLEDRRQQLEKLNAEEDDLIGKREGALAASEAAQSAGDEEGLERHTAAFNRFDGRIQEIEASQARFEFQIKESEGVMKQYMLQLTEMQAEIQKLPQQKAEAIADFVTSSKIVELSDRLSGMQSSFDRGPIDAVLDANRKLTAKARIVQKMSGADVRLQDAEYARTGRQSTSSNRMAEMLAARKAERDGKTDAATKSPETEKRERPQI